MTPFGAPGTRVVDLSVTVSEDLPCTWPGHMSFAHHNWNWYAEVDTPVRRTRSFAPYHTNFIVIDEHCGTHFDAPTHFIPPPGSGLPWAGELGTQTGDRVPLEDLIGPAAVIDLRHVRERGSAPGESPWIEPADVQAWEREHGELQPGEIVLLWTGWNDDYYTDGPEGAKCAHEPLVTRTAPGWPAPPPETIVELHARGIRTVGIDAPSIGASHDGAPTHWEGLSRGIRYVEHLVGLGQLAPRGAQFVFLPIKVADGTGAPGRAIAFVPDGTGAAGAAEGSR
jgi:kynurenine formamidase